MVKNLRVYSMLVCVVLLGLGASGRAVAADKDKLVEICGNCHGKRGASTEFDVPIIGGYSAEYLTERLNAYKNQETACPETEFRAGSNKGQKSDMCRIAHDLSAANIKQIVRYFSKQKFVRAKQEFDPALAKMGKEIHEQHCEHCHSKGGTVASDHAGINGGQWMPYLTNALKEFESGKRPITKVMKTRLEKLGKGETEALVNYYGSIR